MSNWDYYRNEPITKENIENYVSALSEQAQAAEIAGDQVRADYLHHGINQELDDLSNGNYQR